jgi:hypothetical protein
LENGRISFTDGNRISLVVIAVLVVTLVVDTIIIKVYYFGIHQQFREFTTILFIVIALLALIGQYYILASKRMGKDQPYVSRLSKIVRLVQIILMVILVATIVQMAVSSGYSTISLQVSLWLSYGLALALLGVLAYRLIVWFSIRRNYVMLLFAISSLTLIANIVFTLILVSAYLDGTKPFSTPRLGVYTPFFTLGSLTGLVSGGYAISSVASFMLTWIATSFLLRHYYMSMGRIKYLGIVSLPLIYFLFHFEPVFLDVLSSITSVSPLTASVLYKTTYSLSTISAGIFFGIAFWVIVKGVGYNNVVRNYVTLAAYGYLLLFVSNEAIVLISAPYPPFGLPTISFLGLAAFLVLTGIYSSAVSLSQDAKLRQLIRTSTLKQTEFLDSIGMAHMEREISSSVFKLAKDNREILEGETGIKTSFTDEELKKYLTMVQDEIRQHKKR